MAPPDMKAQELLDATNMNIADLEARLSELSRLSSHRRPPLRKMPDRRGDGNDGDDEFEEHSESVYTSQAPTPLFIAAQALPSHCKPGPTTSPTATMPYLLVKSSDGLRDNHTAPHTPSLSSSALLANVQASIHAAIPFHTAALREARLAHKPDTHPRPQPPPKLWTTTPTARPSPSSPDALLPGPPLPRARTAPLFSTRLTESPHRSRSRSRSRSRKQPARVSAPSAAAAASYTSDSESGSERGRPLAISKPMLQHPILVAGVHLDVGVGAPRPLGQAAATGDGDVGGMVEAACRAAQQRRGAGGGVR
ncbi:hypothetical protein P171DRAFT_490092 [Karstenula rhodostoma CBS 690.94]|uniref:Uncharacterized protein n=1 Tax=Karstenula rhodostoma CBS 690.94 TaxID=1392251 RepID=A0A9P4P6P9_9PLEO|nr:hypothetical protein P171DRAFT_490092 [Karstenula rhodostoma CBS 690.94]